MMYTRFLTWLYLLIVASFLAPTIAFACADTEQDCHGACIPETYLCILEPLPGGAPYFDPSTASGPLEPFRQYIQSGVWQWAFRVGVAIAILNGVYGGFMMVKSNGDQGQIDEGKQRFLWSALGIVILLLAGPILVFLNPLGFTL